MAVSLAFKLICLGLAAAFDTISHEALLIYCFVKYARNRQNGALFFHSEKMRTADQRDTHADVFKVEWQCYHKVILLVLVRLTSYFAELN